MRILTVEPGPNFSVADVHTGWTEALRRGGHEVANFNLGDRLQFLQVVLQGRVDQAELPHTAARMAAETLRGACFDFWPDLVVITSAFFVPPECYEVIRSRNMRIVVLLTESPYEDPAQYHIAARADLAIVNDPTNLDTYRQHQPETYYLPHSYDPTRHYRREPSPDLKCDFGWVGTAYKSRIAFFEAVDWNGADVALAGNWQDLPDGSPLEPYLVHDRPVCFHNDAAIDLYSSAKASANVYRREAANDDFSDGWSMGPREVELAAVGTFFLRDPRPEGDEILHMLPTFDGPGDFSEKLAWWLAHDLERERRAAEAQAAVAKFTFDNRTRFMLERVDHLPTR